MGNAQFGPPEVEVIDDAQEAAPIDITGNWVSIVTEDWRYRILTGDVGDTEGYFLTELGTRVAESWDPATDEASGEACRAYGAAGIMRQPTRLQISWENNNTLEIETDAGMQTRRLKFGEAQDGAGTGSWQGVSNANWNLHRQGRGGPVISGTLEVETHGMRQGYLRRNGVPYSDQSTMQEYFDVVTQDDGTEYLIVLSIVEDPVFLNGPAMTSSNFRREANDNLWDPSGCLTQ
ncbi:MAG: hypothetical protein COA71_08230 [SAR86 cluster bacterium]|uniref:Uncharacterized protein n=1 Tax=SAR86 cluster bacterium TaxID=2030880 RepID=A0A2A5CCC9_9GAMM|nr:MAG: hypothetical protein COA71_08230 [SAR86 cluster bacterium]